MTDVKDKKFQFTLVLDGVSDISTEFEDAIFEAGCDDCSIILRAGRVCLEFDRVSDCYLNAVTSAISDLTKVALDVSVVRVDESDLVSQSEIGRRLGCSRQNVHQLAQSATAHFPCPIANITEGQTQWWWHEIAGAMHHRGLLSVDVAENALSSAIINHVLERRHFEQKSGRLLSRVEDQIEKATVHSCQIMHLDLGDQIEWNAPAFLAARHHDAWESFKATDPTSSLSTRQHFVM